MNLSERIRAAQKEKVIRLQAKQNADAQRREAALQAERDRCDRILAERKRRFEEPITSIVLPVLNEANQSLAGGNGVITVSYGTRWPEVETRSSFTNISLIWDKSPSRESFRIISINISDRNAVSTGVELQRKIGTITDRNLREKLETRIVEMVKGDEFYRYEPFEMSNKR